MLCYAVLGSALNVFVSECAGDEGQNKQGYECVFECALVSFNTVLKQMSVAVKQIETGLCNFAGLCKN